MSKKPDLRTIYTQNLIKSTLISLLEEKDISKITVKELCDKAEISKGTFYLHYCNIYDVLEGIESEFIATMQEDFIAMSSTGNDIRLDITKNFFDRYMNNRLLILIVQQEKDYSHFINKLLSSVSQFFLPKLQEDFGLKKDEATYLITFIFHGSMAVTKKLLEKNNHGWNSAQLVIDKYMLGGANALLQSG